jgi:hypothetical protein
VSKNYIFSLLFSGTLSKVISSQILLFLLGPKYGYIFTQRFSGLYTPSNSMRGTRLFLPFFIVIILRLIKKIKKSNDPMWFTTFLSTGKGARFAGGILGLFVLWSSDFSLGSLAAFLVLYIFLSIFYYKQGFKIFIKNIFLFFITYIIFALIAMSVVSKGHPLTVLKSLADTGEYQFFYFNGEGMPILVYFFRQKWMWVYTVLLVLVLLYYLYLLINKNFNDRDVAVVFIILSIIAATFAYVLSGSGHNFREGLEVYCILTIFALFAQLIFNLIKKKYKIYKSLNIFMISILALFSVYSVFLTYKATKIEKQVNITRL